VLVLLKVLGDFVLDDPGGTYPAEPRDFRAADTQLYRRTGKREQDRENLTAAMTMYREMDMGF
jgi:hypothetical protein